MVFVADILEEYFHCAKKDAQIIVCKGADQGQRKLA